jgi:cytochrome b involved in lipid metabolism
MLKFMNGRKDKETGKMKDAWSVYQGKVYNISPYLPYHPGGEGELRRCAGKDGTKLFMEVHPWVNWENMLGECMVGISRLRRVHWKTWTERLSWHIYPIDLHCTALHTWKIQWKYAQPHRFDRLSYYIF